jgi:hypothetical protein
MPAGGSHAKPMDTGNTGAIAWEIFAYAQQWALCSSCHEYVESYFILLFGTSKNTIGFTGNYKY